MLWLMVSVHSRQDTLLQTLPTQNCIMAAVCKGRGCSQEARRQAARKQEGAGRDSLLLCHLQCTPSTRPSPLHLLRMPQAGSMTQMGLGDIQPANHGNLLTNPQVILGVLGLRITGTATLMDTLISNIMSKQGSGRKTVNLLHLHTVSFVKKTQCSLYLSVQ